MTLRWWVARAVARCERLGVRAYREVGVRDRVGFILEASSMSGDLKVRSLSGGHFALAVCELAQGFNGYDVVQGEVCRLEEEPFSYVLLRYGNDGEYRLAPLLHSELAGRTASLAGALRIFEAGEPA